MSAAILQFKIINVVKRTEIWRQGKDIFFAGKADRDENYSGPNATSARNGNQL